MFRTACIFVALALCAATAPPRISLELAVSDTDGPFNGRRNIDEIRTKNLDKTTSHDLSQFCDADASDGASGAACKFPVAKAYDHLDGEIDETSITKVYTLVDSDKVDKNMVAACATNNCTSLDDLTNPAVLVDGVAQPAQKTRSTYLFTYDVSDAHGNGAEQVTFALIINDVIFPEVHNALATTANGFTTTEATTDPVAIKSVTNTIESGSSDQFQGHIAFTCTDPQNIDAMTAVLTQPAGGTGSDNMWMQMSNAAICKSTFTTTATCTDFAGFYSEHGTDSNAISMSVTTTYQDTTDPVLLGDDETLHCAKNATTSGVTLSTCADVGNLPTPYTSATFITENFESDFAAKVITTGRAVGTYVFTQTCTDACDELSGIPLARNSDTESRTITVHDVTPPALNTTYEENVGSTVDSAVGATYKDQHAIEVSAEQHFTNRVFHIVPANSTKWHELCDPDSQGGGTSAICAIANDHNDTNGAHLMEKYTCTAQGDCELDETGVGTHTFALHARMRFHDECCLAETGDEITESWGANGFESHVVGTYTRTFTVNDCSDNENFVHVEVTLQDPDAPVIHMESCNADIHGGHEATCMNHEEASNTVEYTDYGAQCHDYVDGVLSHAVEVSGMVVNMRVVGTYLINYDCADLSGNAATPAQRTVIVQDTTPPVCLFDTARDQGVNMNFVEAGFPYVDAGVTMSDSLDGECVEGESSNSADVQCNGPAESPTEGHGTITVTGNTVTTGEVFYRFNSCDSIRKVQSTMPANGQYIITPTGSSVRVLVNCYFTGSSDSDPAVTFLVYFGNDFAAAPVLGDCTKVLGTHAVKMEGTATSVNHAALLTSLDFVSRTNKAELATQVLDAQQSLENACAIYGTADVQVTDGSTTITNDVTKAEPGVYRITFDGEDRVGNKCPSIIRTVIVRDTLPPVISLVHPTRAYSGATNADGSFVNDNMVFQHTSDGAVGLNGQRNWDTPGGAAHHAFMAETSSVNGWFIGAVACAVSGVALLATSMKKAATSVPV